MYIYKIINLLENKVYIGQSNNFRSRKAQHKYHLCHNNHTNKLLQKDYNEYGLNIFKFEIIEECDDDISLERETYWINYYGGIESQNTYNQCDKDSHNSDYINNQSKAQLGKHYISNQGKLKISQAHLGKKLTKNHIKKIKENAKYNPNFGMKNKNHSEEAKQKMRVAKQGKYKGSDNPNYKYTPEFINQLRNEYICIKNYNELSRKYNINSNTISRLIRLGKC